MSRDDRARFCSIRPAVDSDARGIAEVNVASWRAAYRGLMSDQVLDDLDVDARAERWRTLLRDPAIATFVAVEFDVVVGFGALRPTRDEDSPEGTGEIPTLYLRPSHWRRGIGSRLLRALFEEARRRGYASVTLWVLAANERARAFYENEGLWTDGATKVDDRFDGAPLREVRYRTSC